MPGDPGGGGAAVKAVVLKPGRDKAVRNRHHWIFSGAIRDMPDFEDGAILPVQSSGGELLGHGYFNRKSSITGRMIAFGAEPPEAAVRHSVERALALRAKFFDPAVTNARRLINAEGDGLPGLIADLYDDVLVIQVATLGMEKLKPLIIDLFAGALKPRTIFERSDLPARREEGLEPAEALLAGEPAEKVRILESGISYWVSLVEGQKTGFYLDQRESRRLVRECAAGRRVLNAFAYTGSFSVCALLGGAVKADSVDSSAAAMALAQDNFELNGLASDSGTFFTADVFEFLREPVLDHDFIILDPPAFAKKRTDVVAGCRGYKDINRLALQRVRTPGLVLTFSCSHFVEESLFQQVVFQAAGEAGRRVRILQRHRQAFDHPVNIYHPETAYLKGFLLYVD
ncbi:MAG: class I SAM-dependent rRNA methyltransferase [Candidatus Aminicenantes bacterium]|nr:MAG: class I SAM-dependent rRNA methyltransferase [Candidatus Aminicenantes bacterium]